MWRLAHHSAAAASVATAGAVHFQGDPYVLIYWPLSTFRDGPTPWLGAVLFFALGTLVACQWAIAGVRERAEERNWLTIAAVAFWLTAATPSFDSFHGLCSAVTFLSLAACLFFAARDERLPLIWPLAYGAFAFVVLTVYMGYGVGQKCLVATLVILGTLRVELGERFVQRPRRHAVRVAQDPDEAKPWKRLRVSRPTPGTIFEPHAQRPRTSLRRKAS